MTTERTRKNVKKTRAKKKRIYCPFLEPQVRMHLEEKATSLSFSAEEKLKRDAMKQYFRQFWTAANHSHKLRSARRQAMEDKLSGIPEEQKKDELANYYSMESRLLRMKRSRMSKNDFMVLAVLGKGGFGEVYLARKKDTGEVLALKKMPKSHFTDSSTLVKLKREREVMMQHVSPWLVRLKYSFQSDRYIYLAMDYVPGGDLKNLLDHVGCFSEPNAKYYLAEMVMAVEALHQMGYIHRDLKPDNFLLDRNGHIKLIDFGLSQEGLHQKYSGTFTMKIRSLSNVNTIATGGGRIRSNSGGQKSRKLGRKAYSVVGSPQYMAIEILEQVGYNHSVDYWSLGIILYELLYGITPFSSDSVEETFQMLCMWEEYVVLPDELDDEEEASPESWDFITRLLTTPEKRLGSRSMTEIKEHPFFHGIDWKGLYQSEPPFIPTLEDELDISYFEGVLNEEDFASLTVDEKDIEQLLTAQRHDAESFPLHLLDPERWKDRREIGPRSTTYSNEGEQSAFAGWTYKHDDLNVLLSKLDTK